MPEMDVKESHYCTCDPIGRIDNCERNNDRALQFFPNNTNTAHIIGVSVNVGCDRQPKIYNRVAFYADWIANHVWPNHILRERTWYDSITELLQFLVEYFTE